MSELSDRDQRLYEMALADIRRAEKMLPAIDHALSIIFDRPQTKAATALTERQILGHCFLCLLPIYGKLRKLREGNAHPGCVLDAANDCWAVEYD